MMIGDTFEADVLGAEGVGMHTLFYNYRDEIIPDRYEKVETLIDIKNHL
jgi:putative hydrolase of the HAD superfamily